MHAWRRPKSAHRLGPVLAKADRRSQRARKLFAEAEASRKGCRKWVVAVAWARVTLRGQRLPARHPKCCDTDMATPLLQSTEHYFRF